MEHRQSIPLNSSNLFFLDCYSHVCLFRQIYGTSQKIWVYWCLIFMRVWASTLHSETLASRAMTQFPMIQTHSSNHSHECRFVLSFDDVMASDSFALKLISITMTSTWYYHRFKAVQLYSPWYISMLIAIVILYKLNPVSLHLSMVWIKLYKILYSLWYISMLMAIVILYKLIWLHLSMVWIPYFLFVSWQRAIDSVSLQGSSPQRPGTYTRTHPT